MNLSRSAVLMRLALLCAASQMRGDGVPEGAIFPSPNGKYSVTLKQIDREWRYAIEETKTGRFDDSVIMPTVLLYLTWAADSKSIISVEHIARGSIGRVLYFKYGKWSDLEVAPPGGTGWMTSSVVELKVQTNGAHYKFAVSYEKANGASPTYMLCELDVNLHTGRFENLVQRGISQGEWEANLRRMPQYIPAMRTTTR